MINDRLYIHVTCSKCTRRWSIERWEATRFDAQGNKIGTYLVEAAAQDLPQCLCGHRFNVADRSPEDILADQKQAITIAVGQAQQRKKKAEEKRRQKHPEQKKEASA